MAKTRKKSTKFDGRAAAGNVNSSYTVFFAVCAVWLTFVFSGSFGNLQSKSWVIILGFALLNYFIWDFIKQLYSPGQSVIIYCLMFAILPTALSLSIGGSFVIAGAIVWLGAAIIAGALELLYEGFFKSSAPKKIINRLLLVDNKIDRSMVSLNMKELSFFNYRGLIFAMLLISSYYVLALLLIK